MQTPPSNQNLAKTRDLIQKLQKENHYLHQENNRLRDENFRLENRWAALLRLFKQFAEKAVS